jgi:monoamine oxidase
VATHQTDSADRARSVWTWYLPQCGDDPSRDRRQLLALSFEECAQLVVADLSRAHPDIAQHIERIDVFRWGHAMVRPTPGLFAGAAARVREAAQQPLGPLHFAHTELSGFALFEEAQWHGVRAAEEVLRARNLAAESWL